MLWKQVDIKTALLYGTLDEDVYMNSRMEQLESSRKQFMASNKTRQGLVRFKGDENKAAAVYAGYQALSAEDIADTAWYVANLPKHVCINDLVITCTAQGNSTTIHKD